MSYYSPEDIQQAKQMDLLSYLRLFEPQELVHVSGNTWCTREHDSLKISNGKWNWFSRGIGGRSALDYLVKVKNFPFTDAVGIILGRAAEMPPVSRSEPQEEEKVLLLPDPIEGHPFRVVQYLTDRGIDRRLVEYCVERKLLYESRDYHNAVFVGYDAHGVARYAALRGTMGAYKGEATGSDKHYSFSLCLSTDAEQVHVFESAIDLLSYVTLEIRTGRPWKQDALLSLAGVFKQKHEKVVPVALTQFLSDHPSVRRICLHLDNDEVGRSAAKGIAEGLEDKPYEVVDEPPKYGKDVNDQLQWERLHRRRDARER